MGATHCASWALGAIFLRPAKKRQRRRAPRAQSPLKDRYESLYKFSRRNTVIWLTISYLEVHHFFQSKWVLGAIIVLEAIRWGFK